MSTQSTTVRPYYHPSCNGPQLQHWEVVISTPERDVIYQRSSKRTAEQLAARLAQKTTA